MKRFYSIDFIKGIAIISVLCAHCNAVLNTEHQVAMSFSIILSNFGTAGVLCFFFVSGLLFHYNDNFISFWRKKLIRFIPAWFVSASVVYLYVYLRKPPLSLKSYINFVLGNGSYCYYMTILIVIYAIFTIFPFMRTRISLIICIIITAISVLFIPQIGSVSPYLNIFNWIGYFSLGYLLGIDCFIWFEKRVIKNKIFLSTYFIYGIFLIIQLCRNSAGAYWNNLNAIITWMGALVVITLGIHLSRLKISVLKYIEIAGQESLFVYLWHMPIAGITARIMNINILVDFVLLRPVIVFGVMILAILLSKKILPEFINKFIGLT